MERTVDAHHVAGGDQGLDAVVVGRAKLLLDATIGKTYPSISLPTKELMYKALEGWDETGLPPIEVPKRTAMLLDAHPGGEIYFEPFQ